MALTYSKNKRLTKYEWMVENSFVITDQRAVHLSMTSFSQVLKCFQTSHILDYCKVIWISWNTELSWCNVNVTSFSPLLNGGRQREGLSLSSQTLWMEPAQHTAAVQQTSALFINPVSCQHRINTDIRHIENTSFWPQSKAALHVSFTDLPIPKCIAMSSVEEKMPKKVESTRESHPSHFMCFCHLVSFNESTLCNVYVNLNPLTCLTQNKTHWSRC